MKAQYLGSSAVTEAPAPVEKSASRLGSSSLLEPRGRRCLADSIMPPELAPYYDPVKSEQVVTGTSIAAAIRASALPDLEARVLLCHVLGVERAWLIAHATDELEAGSVSVYQELCERRRQGEPI